ncbi:hypothetical protein ACVI1L_001650 [Bradyrhizobium sp. USDA 4516]
MAEADLSGMARAETDEIGNKAGYMRGLFLWLRQVAVDRSLPPLALNVAVILAQHVGQRTGDAWPRQETIANALGITDRTVRRNVTSLVARGHLDVVGSGGRAKPNSYRPILKNPTRASGNGAENPDGNSVHLSDQNPDANSVRVSDQKPGRARSVNPDARGRNPDAARQKPGRTASAQELPNELPIELPKGTTQYARARESDHRNGVDESDHSGKPRGSQLRVNGEQHAEGFDEFYRTYPRHVARGQAEKAYQRIVSSGAATSAELLAGAQRYAAARTGEPERFTKHPATWLNGKCWLDEPAARPETPAERIKRQCGLLGNSDEETEHE